VTRPTDASVAAVLPLAGRDVARARLLFATLRRFRHPITRLHVVVPDSAIRADFESVIRSAGVPDVQVRLESEVFGGWRGGLRPSTWLGRCTRRGWYLQQMLKLAVAAEESDGWMLTLDADVLLLRDCDPGEWFNQGRASTVVLDAMQHRLWYRRAARLLRLSPPSFEVGVTPALLHRATCGELLNRLTRADRDWKQRLAWSWGWSEYALYATWAEHTGAFKRHHRPMSYDAWFAPSVWHHRDWPEWRPSALEIGQPPRPPAARSAPFAVVQSHLGIPPDAIAQRLDLEA
jgi:hypothetical protein